MTGWIKGIIHSVVPAGYILGPAGCSIGPAEYMIIKLWVYGPARYAWPSRIYAKLWVDGAAGYMLGGGPFDFSVNPNPFLVQGLGLGLGLDNSQKRCFEMF